MFDALDDPTPFRPTPELRRRVVRDGRARKRARRGLVAGSAGVLVAVAIAPVWYLRQQADELDRVHIGGLATAPDTASPASAAPGPTVPPARAVAGPVNVLVVGVDTRGDGAVEGARTDTVAVVRLDPGAGRITVLSLPRDLFVPIDGGDPARLNSALAQGRTALVRTVVDAIGAPIDHYIELDFAGFTRLVDLAGGVDVPFETAVRDLNTGFSAGPGCVHLDGAVALAYVRSRKLETLDADGSWRRDPSADLGRIARQQDLAARLVEQVLAGGFSAADQLRIVTDVLDDVTVDEGLDVDGLRSLWATAATIGATHIAHLSLATSSGPRPWGTSRCCSPTRRGSASARHRSVASHRRRRPHRHPRRSPARPSRRRAVDGTERYERTPRSRRMLARLPRIVVRLIASMTASAAAAGTSTVEKLSATLIGPMSLPVRSDSLAIAPTRSPGRILSRRPRLMNSRVLLPGGAWNRPPGRPGDSRGRRSSRSRSRRVAPRPSRSLRGTNSGISTSSPSDVRASWATFSAARATARMSASALSSSRIGPNRCRSSLPSAARTAADVASS